MKGTTKNKGRKDELDRFYTKPEVARRLVSELLDRHPDISSAVLFEPSAGDGAFVRAMEDEPRIYDGYIAASDIAPAQDALCETEIFECDFLGDGIETVLSSAIAAAGIDADEDPGALSPDDERVVFIGNPPFGEQGRLAIDFVIRALSLARRCAFILPPSFRKESVQDRISGFGAVTDIIELEDESYRVGDGLIAVPSAFFVFDSKEPFSPEEDMQDRLPFHPVSNDPANRPTADFAIRRVGGTAGSATWDVEGCSKETYYFYMMDEGCPEDIVDVINGCEFPERDWSVGPRSLSRKEIAKHVFEALNARQ